MSLRKWIYVAACLLPVAANGAQTNAAACHAALTLDQWQPFLTLAGDVSRDRAISLLQNELNWQKNVVSNLRLTPATQKIENNIWGALRSYDIKKVYNLLPNAQEKWHSLTLRGSAEPEFYRISRAAPSAIDKPPYDLGDSISKVAMRPLSPPDHGPGGDYYELRGQWHQNVGPVAWRSVRNAMRLGLKVISRPAPVEPPQNALTAAAKNNPGLTANERQIAAQLWQAYPYTSAWYAGIGEIKSIHAQDQTASPAHHVHLTFELDKHDLQKRYPDVAHYLKRLGNSFAAHVVIRNQAGRWATLTLDSANRRLIMDTWVFDGHIVPTQVNEPPHPEPNTGAKPLKALSFDAITNLRLQALGITVQLNHWPIAWHYKRTDTGAKYTADIAKKPRIKVSGRALGIIPSGLMEAVLPVNVEETVDDFMQVLTQSNHGNGAHMEINFRNNSQSGHGSLLFASGDATTLDNFFVHFGLRLTIKRMMPDHAELVDLRHLVRDNLNAFGKDLNRLGHIEHTSAKALKRCSRKQ